MYDKETIEYAQEQEHLVSNLEYRFYQHDDDRSHGHQELMRDYARVLYSSSFRRLQGKMQLFAKNYTISIYVMQFRKYIEKQG